MHVVAGLVRAQHPDHNHALTSGGGVHDPLAEVEDVPEDRARPTAGCALVAGHVSVSRTVRRSSAAAQASPASWRHRSSVVTSPAAARGERGGACLLVLTHGLGLDGADRRLVLADAA